MLVPGPGFAYDYSETHEKEVRHEDKEQVNNQEQALVKNQVKNRGEEIPQMQERERIRKQEQVRAEVHKTIENQADWFAARGPATGENLY
jgi:hypothetical protein